MIERDVDKAQTEEESHRSVAILAQDRQAHPRSKPSNDEFVRVCVPLDIYIG
ncbi:Uncharacterized protein APZ42_030405 [Daphnia magna]|uniref:Uncharacterized protein n=1 Tax=Daphnia magna TaxID=35525 RepID=A0A164NT45_9CRUS|nr:Uncharacterized protein APZ42_030405 [Daphnia magna]